MLSLPRLVPLVALAVLIGSAGCSSTVREQPTHAATHPEQAVLAALARYEDAMRRMDFEEVAGVFTESGEVSTPGTPPVQGRETIRKFLQSFASFKIIEISVHAEHTQVTGATANQVGSYAQAVVIPGGETVHVHGQFEATWSLAPSGEWQLARMHTTPSP